MYDLEERTMEFAVNIRHFIQKIPERTIRIDDLRQLIRSSGSIGANYIEENSISNNSEVPKIILPPYRLEFV